MPNIFGEDIAGEILDAMGSLVFDVSLIKVSKGIRDSQNPTLSVPSEKTVTGKGFVDDYENRHVDGTIVRRGDRKVSILGASLPSGIVPQSNDRTIIEGEEKTIINVMRDPASAVYECQVR